MTPLPELMTFPARPINGGRLELAPTKPGRWHAEPKYNGWRALLHAPSGTFFNRQGERLTIGHKFMHALPQLRSLGSDWVDTEGFACRHDVAKGTPIVLDIVVPNVSYEERRAMLLAKLPVAPLRLDELKPNALYVTPSFDDERALYEQLKQLNNGVDFYEGVVCKLFGSTYPIQRRSSSQETRLWIKHRFL